MEVIALDPGVTTGYAVGVISESGKMIVESWQEKYTHRGLWNQLLLTGPDAIIYESFEYRNKSRDGLVLYSLEMIGVIELYCQVKDIECFKQTASTGKGYYSDTHLKKAGVYVKAQPHGMDALRHLLQWFTFGPGYQYNKQGFESV